MRRPQLPFPYSAPTVPGASSRPPPARKLGADYDTDWARRFPARLARLALLEAVHAARRSPRWARPSATASTASPASPTAR